jgi:hypothetical protein
LRITIFRMYYLLNILSQDPIGRRNGRQPLANMQTILQNAIETAKGMVNKNLVPANKPLTQKIVQEALNILRGSVMIVYPMQLPPHDPIRMEFSNTEDLSGTQVSAKGSFFPNSGLTPFYSVRRHPWKLSNL